MSFPEKRKRSGFTLLELLITIGIIMILASLLTPSLLRSKEYARRVVCAQNLRHLGLALNLYAQDWQGYFPWHYKTDFKQLSDSGGNFNTGLGLLYPSYLKNPRIYFCPSEREYTFETKFPSGSTYYGNYDFYGSEQSGGTYQREKDSRNTQKALVADVEVSWGSTYQDLSNRLKATHKGEGHNVLHLGGDVLWYPIELTRDTLGDLWGGPGAWPDWEAIDGG